MECGLGRWYSRGVRTMPEQNLSPEIERSFLFVHRANIQRYERLLQTYLTDYERAFIRRRLDEEQDALTKLVAIHA